MVMVADMTPKHLITCFSLQPLRRWNVGVSNYCADSGTKGAKSKEWQVNVYELQEFQVCSVTIKGVSPGQSELVTSHLTPS